MIGNYQIFTDATADLTPELMAGLPSVEIIPMQVAIGGKEYSYGSPEGISAEEFYKIQRCGNFATTSQINPTIFFQSFEPWLRQGTDILYLCFSSGMSGTYQSAVLAAEELQAEYPERKIICIDTLGAAAGEGFLVREAVKQQMSGLTIDELATWVMDHRLKVCHWVVVDTFTHLKHGGRVSATTAAIFSRLSSSTTAVYVTSTVQEAMPYLTDQRLCLVILDAEISQKDNHTLLKSIKKLKTTPILVLSSQPGHAQRLETLKAGAHAYMGTPYTMEECLAQAQSLMQIYVDSHPEKHTYFTLAFGDNLVIDPSTRQVFIKDKEIKFTRKEFDLLFWLASNPGQVFSREQLYDHVWDEDSVYNVDDVVKAHIKALRRKLSDTDVAYIKNVWGIGYRFHNEPDDE